MGPAPHSGHTGALEARGLAVARVGTAQPDRTFCHTDDAEFPSNVLDGLCDGVVHAAGLADASRYTPACSNACAAATVIALSASLLRITSAEASS